MASQKIIRKAGDEKPGEKSPRHAGVLLHITSLPSPFGIGDLGPEAEKFADFLKESRQHYWQLLPLNPIGPEQSYSPYSSISSMAGNVLLISPEKLVTDGLLTSREINRYKSNSTGKVDFQLAKGCRETLLQIAYNKTNKDGTLEQEFKTFIRKEAYWLEDFALFLVLKAHHRNAAWYRWPDAFKRRHGAALSDFSKRNEQSIRFVKWQQFTFFRQWQALKSYVNRLDIEMFGDLPFYVSYDSADVWSHPEIFNVDQRGKMTGVAGVPPDYFNKNGQLWGMPTFRWETLKRKKYSWWVERIRKNMDLYDMLRLDHFRAFADYWEVPATHTTAIRGNWKRGPGQLFFSTLRKVFPELPFVAEDLGDINDAVYALRDDNNLPGMKVLQFAFGDTMPTSDYIPHNYSENFIAYTGTHDNNTTRGWYRKNMSSKERSQISSYLGKNVDEENVSDELSRLAYASIAKTVIIPFQDILGLKEDARMNTPASTTNNWQWRFKQSDLTRAIRMKLREWVHLYNR